MSNELLIKQKKDVEIAETLSIDVDIYRALRYSLFPDDSIPEYAFGLYLAACKAKNYDPLKKPYHIVMMNINVNPNKKAEPIWEKRPTIMPGIISLRIDAERTNKFAGMSETEFGPMITEKFVDKTVCYPEWAKLTVYKMFNGIRIEIPAKLYWKECYGVSKKGSTIPNDMWTKRPRAMLEKCVNAHALRIAFSEEIGGMHTPDELREPMDEPIEKDVTPDRKLLENAPISQQNETDNEALQQQLDAINNCMSWDELKAVYTQAKEAVKGDKNASNKISKATKERQDYIRQLKVEEEKPKEEPKPEQSNDEFLKAYDAGTQI